MSNVLTREELLGMADIQQKEVVVPEWGNKVVVIRSFTKSRQQQLRKDAMGADGLDADRLEMLMFIHGVVDPPLSGEDYAILTERNAGAVDRVLKEVLAISGMGPEALDRAEASFR